LRNLSNIVDPLALMVTQRRPFCSSNCNTIV
jgi:hypothetical protein